MSRVVIYASARVNGNTAKLLQHWQWYVANDPVIDLTQLQILPFSYQSDSRADDFEETIRALLTYEQWLWVTPVYWYSMTSWHKLFLDRMSDLLTYHKPLGRQLRGKSLAVLTNSASESLPKCFSDIFELTANYLGMAWLGAEHIPAIDDQFEPEQLTQAISRLHLKCSSHLP